MHLGEGRVAEHPPPGDQQVGRGAEGLHQQAQRGRQPQLRDQVGVDGPYLTGSSSRVQGEQAGTGVVSNEQVAQADTVLRGSQAQPSGVLDLLGHGGRPQTHVAAEVAAGVGMDEARGRGSGVHGRVPPRVAARLSEEAPDAVPSPAVPGVDGVDHELGPGAGAERLAVVRHRVRRPHPCGLIAHHREQPLGGDPHDTVRIGRSCADHLAHLASQRGQFTQPGKTVLVHRPVTVHGDREQRGQRGILAQPCLDEPVEGQKRHRLMRRRRARRTDRRARPDRAGRGRARRSTAARYPGPAGPVPRCGGPVRGRAPPPGRSR